MVAWLSWDKIAWTNKQSDRNFSMRGFGFPNVWNLNITWNESVQSNLQKKNYLNGS